jgi:tetratricopeptide (TPR) repeat protein
MRKSQRSSRNLVRWWLGGAFGVLLVPGCGLGPDMEDIMESPLKYEVKELTPQALEARMKQIDDNYAEPRTPGKVFLSYETCMDSISPVNGYVALWRGARACAWLAEHVEGKAKREEHALKGIAIGREAIKKDSARVESYYYLAMCYAQLADARRSASRDLLREMRDRMEFACALDEKFDFCGPHRFLGTLMAETHEYTLYGIGTIGDALKHLKKAIQLCPDYGDNHLAYAKGLIEDGEKEEARVELEKVLAAPRPPDRSAEHDAWISEATKLLRDLPAAEG